MSNCPRCEELNEEKYPITITDIMIQGNYYRWNCEIIYCPCCGKRLKKYNVNND